MRVGRNVAHRHAVAARRSEVHHIVARGGHEHETQVGEGGKVVGGEAHFVEDNHVGIATALHHLFGGGASVDGEAALSGEGFPA